MTEPAHMNQVSDQFENLCRKGSHPLVTLFEVVAKPTVHTISWCPICGAVVGDTETDGDMKLGGIFKFRKPKMTGGEG